MIVYVRDNDSIYKLKCELTIEQFNRAGIYNVADDIRKLIKVNDLVKLTYGGIKQIHSEDFTEGGYISSLLKIKELWIFDSIGRYYKVAEANKKGVLELV